MHSSGAGPGSADDNEARSTFGARIDLLAEQLWAPALESGAARLAAGTSAGDGWTVAETYVVLPNVRKATMLMPASPRSATVGALLNYRGLRKPVQNVQRMLLGGWALTGAPLPFPRLSVTTRAESLDPMLPMAVLSRELDSGPLFASIGVRTGANRKATLQLVDGHGSPVGYAKLGWETYSDEAVRREAAALSEAPSSGPTRAPGLLWSGTVQGRPCLVTKPLPLSARAVRGAAVEPSPEELYALLPLTRRAPVATSLQYRDLRRRVAELPRSACPEPLRALLEGLLDDVGSYPQALPLTERWHGDFTPWNAARDDAGTLWCWDWESSERDAVAGMDPLHWHLTAATEMGQRLDGALLAQAAEKAWPSFVATGGSRDQWAVAIATYAATLTERACRLAAGAGGWEEQWVLPGQIEDVLRTSAAMRGAHSWS